MTTPDHIASTAEVIDRRILPVAEGDPRIGDGHTIARALDAAGLLATPAHDAAVAAKALVGLTYEPTREGWTPYQPWMRDVLADDARTSALFTFHDGESRVAWQDCHGDDAWFVRRDLRIHPDDCPERPVDEDGEAHSTVGNDPCVCLSEEPCRVHDDIEDVTEEPPVDTAPDVDPDEAVWTNDAQVDDDPDLESVVRAQLDGHGVECHGAVRITSARIARAAREHIYAEPAQEWVARDIREAEARAVQAEAERDAAKEEAAEAHSTAIYAEQRARKAEAERDEWKAHYMALRADVEGRCRNSPRWADPVAILTYILDRDDEQGQAQAQADGVPEVHDWEPHDLPDPSSAGAVLQRGHICRDCGKVEDR